MFNPKEIEFWKDIEGYKGLYQVSNKGRFKSLRGWNGHEYVKRTKYIKGSIQTMDDGYKRIKIFLTKNKNRKQFMAHHLVLETFVCKRPDGLICNHKNGNALKNELENLEWVTQQRNVVHAYENGRHKRIQISKEIIEELYLNKHKSVTEISDILGITESIVWRNLKRHGIKARTISEIKNKYNLTVEKIQSMLENGYTQTRISEVFGCDQSNISHFISKSKQRGEWTK